MTPYESRFIHLLLINNICNICEICSDTMWTVTVSFRSALASVVLKVKYLKFVFGTSYCMVVWWKRRTDLIYMLSLHKVLRSRSTKQIQDPEFLQLWKWQHGSCVVSLRFVRFTDLLLKWTVNECLMGLMCCNLLCAGKSEEISAGRDWNNCIGVLTFTIGSVRVLNCFWENQLAASQWVQVQVQVCVTWWRPPGGQWSPLQAETKLFQTAAWVDVYPAAWRWRHH